MAQLISKDGTKIAYTKIGNGLAVILVDGAFCFRENGPTAKLAAELSAQFTVYYYDRRGRGKSTDTLPYSVDRELEDLDAIMKCAGGSAYVYGMSSGAALVIKAVAKGLPAKKVVLYEVPFVAVDTSTPNPPSTAIKDVDALIATGRRSQAVTYFMTKVFGAPTIAIKIMKMVIRDAWKKNISVAHTLQYDFQIMGDWSVPKEASQVRVPTLMLCGEKAPKKLQMAADATAMAIPNAQRGVLPGQSHNVSATVLAPVLVKYFSK